MRTQRISRSLAAALLCGFLHAGAAAAATFEVPDAQLQKPLVLVAYGDTRFTDSAETTASSPRARRALIARIARERPAAIFINGDLPWHGMTADYEVYRAETSRWRAQHLRVYPALGNHEFAVCQEPLCLERWWHTFPELRHRRWYSVALGNKLLGVVLDSVTSLLPGSEQRLWLEEQMAALDPRVRVVLIILHHPPLADVQTVNLVDHNPRPNELALADYLDTIAPQMRARFVVSAGHIHNYERLQRGAIVYLVSGGGGATPYEVTRSAADAYKNADFPNYHYVRFELRGNAFVGQMIRLEDSAARTPRRWEIRDRFELSLRP